jgi:hypothetical protein
VPRRSGCSACEGEESAARSLASGVGGRGLKRRPAPAPHPPPPALHPLETGRSGRQGVARHDGLTLGTTAPRQPPRGCTGGWFGTELTQHTRLLANAHPSTLFADVFVCSQQCALRLLAYQQRYCTRSLSLSLVCLSLFLSVSERASLHMYLFAC